MEIYFLSELLDIMLSKLLVVYVFDHLLHVHPLHLQLKVLHHLVFDLLNVGVVVNVQVTLGWQFVFLFIFSVCQSPD